MKLFAREKELRIVKNRGHFPIPTIMPQSTKIETTHNLDKALEAVDEEVTEMIKAVRQSEESHEREQEQAKNRDEQLRLTRPNQQARLQFPHTDQQLTQSETTMQEQINQLSISTRIQYATSTYQPI